MPANPIVKLKVHPYNVVRITFIDENSDTTKEVVCTSERITAKRERLFDESTSMYFDTITLTAALADGSTEQIFYTQNGGDYRSANNFEIQGVVAETSDLTDIMEAILKNNFYYWIV